MKARRQQCDLIWNDAQLTLLDFSRISLNSNYASLTQFVIDMSKLFFWFMIPVIGHDLKLDPISSKVIKVEFSPEALLVWIQIATSEWCHSNGPHTAGDYILWWSKWGKHLYGTCVVMGLPYWTLVDRRLVCGSCNMGLGPGFLHWQPHHCQWCGWWQQHWFVSHWALLFYYWTSFLATFFSAFSCLFNSFFA